MNLISVLVPVYKVKRQFLSQSISSILEQSYDNIELIVIFEKSNSDYDDEIESTFEENSDDHRFKIIIPKKKGLANSLNEGLVESKGQYIARMDADDISEKNRLEEQISFIKESNNDLVGSWALSISEEGKVLGTIEPPVTHLEIRKKIMFHNPFLHPSILFRKEILEKVGFYNPKFNGAEDYDLYFRVMSENFRVSNMPKFLLRLRETTGSVMRGENWKLQRLIYLNVKKNAMKNLGFSTPRDLFYYYLSTFTRFVSPKNAYLLKKKIGYNKTV